MFECSWSNWGCVIQSELSSSKLDEQDMVVIPWRIAESKFGVTLLQIKSVYAFHRKGLPTPRSPRETNGQNTHCSDCPFSTSARPYYENAEALFANEFRNEGGQTLEVTVRHFSSVVQEDDFFAPTVVTALQNWASTKGMRNCTC